MQRPTREQIREANQQGYVDREKLAETAAEKKRQAAAKIEEESGKILEEVKNLHLERDRTMALPMEKGGLLEFVREEFKRKREAFLIKPLQEHLRGCQEVGVEPFDPQRIRYNFPDANMLLWFVFTEKDIEEAVAALGEGITEEEREKKIKAIDIKIAQLSKRLENLA